MSKLAANTAEAYQKAGQIAAEVRSRARRLVDVNTRIIDICENVENWIRELGASPAFPCNVSINEIAAHYTSPLRDPRIIPERSIVKVDIGVHVDGYIADTAVTICLNPEYRRLVTAAEESLQAGIDIMKAGVRAYEVGAVIERKIRDYGLKPIWNLTGHMVSRYNLHAGQVIPNVHSLLNRQRLNVGDVYAVEPFTTLPSATGEVINGEVGHIHLFLRKRPVKKDRVKEMMNYILASYKSLPFAERWVFSRFSDEDSIASFSELLRSKCLYSYPTLVEKSKSLVGQAEHTVLVKEDGCQILTEL
jgi:methionyl aminopeptidase